MRAWDLIVDTNLDVLDTRWVTRNTLRYISLLVHYLSRSPNAPKTLDDLRTELESLAQTVTWSQASLEPLLKVLGRRLARIFTNLMKMMEPIIKFGGGEQVGAGNVHEFNMMKSYYIQVMLEKMKERSIDNFMGRVLVKMVELRKEEKQDIKIEEMIFKDYKLFTETISKDFYTKVRKLSLKAFWRQQFTFYQEKRKSVNWDMSEADDVRFVTDLIRKYVP